MRRVQHLSTNYSHRPASVDSDRLYRSPDVSFFQTRNTLATVSLSPAAIHSAPLMPAFDLNISLPTTAPVNRAMMDASLFSCLLYRVQTKSGSDALFLQASLMPKRSAVKSWYRVLSTIGGQFDKSEDSTQAHLASSFEREEGHWSKIEEICFGSVRVIRICTRREGTRLERTVGYEVH